MEGTAAPMHDAEVVVEVAPVADAEVDSSNAHITQYDAMAEEEVVTVVQMVEQQ